MLILDALYNDSLDWLYSFVDFSMKRHLDDTHRFFKLDRMRQLMALMDNPERSFPSIHVAGTKGKGSTASFCASALQAAGYKVGLYTSPHLQEFTERIKVNGIEINRQELVRLTDGLRQIAGKVPDVTTFELTTAMCFQFFAEQMVDIAVIEVGLGGRLDATNVIDPLVSVITPISYDHRNVLGDTLTEIAFEKGGIIKPGRPVVIAPQAPEAEKELVRLSQERGAPYTLVERAYTYHEVSHTLSTQKMLILLKQDSAFKKLRGSARTPLLLTLPLLGFHQVQNAATALTALDVARQAGFRLTRTAIQKGFRQVEWPARFELLRKHPPVVIDSAHNGDSMRVLRNAIDEYFPDLPIILVFGVSADKELDAMLSEIIPRVEMVVTTQSTHPRAMDAQELARLVSAYQVPTLGVAPAEEAMRQALSLAGGQKGILVAGSVFIAAAARAIWPTLEK